MPTACTTTADLETLQAALGYLMTRHALRASVGLQNGVIFHLELLMQHPQVQISPVLRSAYGLLLHEWRVLAARVQPCPHAASCMHQLH